jgi:hypothetical protein
MIIGNDFLNRTTKAQHLRERMSKWDCIKLRTFCTEKETVTGLKRLLSEWEKIFTRYSSDKGLIPESTGSSKNSTPKESISQ